jgi:hypothetical protein
MLQKAEPVLLLICMGFPILAQQQCREFGLAAAGGPSGYTWRADRCEGVFVQEVAGSTDLKLVSFSAGLDTANFASAPELKLSWTLPAPADVRLRATSLRNRHYYRMDARRTSAQPPSYDWPTDVLRAENLKPEEVGLVAWTQTANFKADVYLPLRIGAASSFKMTLLPAAELDEVYVSLSRLSADGKVVQQIKKEERLGRGYYPAARGFAVPLPPVTVGGYYRLDAAGILKNGGAVTKSFLFYNAAR